MSELLAKSPHPGPPPRQVTLLQHTRDVTDAAEALFGRPACPTRLGQQWVRFFQVRDFDAFVRCTDAAAVFHDWGKANDGFQTIVRGGNPKAQLIRHEHLSGLMLALGPLDDWLRQRPEIDRDVVLGAVISHHLKAGPDNFARPPAELSLIQVPGPYEGFPELLRWSADRLGLSSPPPIPLVWDFDGRPGFAPVLALAEQVQLRLHGFTRAIRRPENDQRHRLLWAVRAGLIAADAAGSGLVRVGRDIPSWIASAFDPAGVCDAATIRERVIEPRVEQIQRSGRWRGWSEFQERAARLPGRALLIEPCGSGKTLAAWRWIAARLGERPAARVIFLYPTRATATEGFRDYVSWAPEADAALIHGTAEFDLQGMFENPDEADDPRGTRRYEADRRLYALGFWPRRIFSATVDQFLAFLQYAYGPVCHLPLLADAVVVIDEVHSFDQAMFSALKAFLRNFDVPVLCMTATLPDVRRRELIECGLSPPAWERPADLRAVSDAPRYSLRQLGSEGEARERVLAALTKGRRVLWVVNQVKRAQRLAQEIGAFPSAGEVICYHSRFKLRDRRDRHREVVGAFQGAGGAVLGVTTQVCEMSLDLDADVLVTEEAPVTALIQRMGRCNRVRDPRPTAGEVLVYPPEDLRPYDRQELGGVDAFLAELAARERVSQTDLEEALRRHGPAAVEPDRLCSFLASGPYAMGGEEDFRDIEDHTTPAVLAGDVAAFLSAGREEQPGFVVPVPRRFARSQSRDTRLPPYIVVAPDEHYSPRIGFCDQPI